MRKDDWQVGTPNAEEHWKKRAFLLWKLLDDIDTLSDVCKGDLKKYAAAVNTFQKLRWKIIDEPEIDVMYKEK
jgi:hypothetical protein